MNKITDDLLKVIDRGESILVVIGDELVSSSGLSNPTFHLDNAQLIWNEHSLIDLATPDAFHQSPDLVWDYHDWKREQAANASPNSGHLSLQQLEAKLGVERMLTISLNTDNLEVKGGLKNVVQLHGSLFKVKCTEWDCIYKGSYEGSRYCPKCKALLRPDIVWFGETVSMPDIDTIDEFIINRMPKYLLLVGVSQNIWPAMGYVDIAKSIGCKVVVFNSLEDEQKEGQNCTTHIKGDCATTLADLLSNINISST